MTGRLGRWFATHPPCSTIADWVTAVRLEIVAERAIDVGPTTEPSAYIESWEDRLAAWGLAEDPLASDFEVERARRIVAGTSPADLPRGR